MKHNNTTKAQLYTVMAISMYNELWYILVSRSFPFEN